MFNFLSLDFKDFKNQFKSGVKILIYLSLIILILLPFGLVNNIGLGKLLGIGALISFILTTLPGSIRRFELQGFFQKVQSILMFSRAQIGILMFLTGVNHYLIVFIHPYTSAGAIPPIKLYTAVSAIALYLSFPLFVTSNNWSKKRLKRNWQRLHNLSYLIIWLIFLHTALLGQKLYTAAILLTAIFQISSLIYSFLLKSTQVKQNTI